MSVKITTREVGAGALVVEIEGRVTLGEGASNFRDTLRDLIAKGHKKILVNLQNTSYMDACGVGEMSSIMSFARQNGAQIKFCHLTKRVEDLLRITKLYTAYDIYEDEAAAIRSFKLSTDIADGFSGGHDDWGGEIADF